MEKINIRFISRLAKCAAIALCSLAFFFPSAKTHAAATLQTLRPASNNLGLVGFWSLDGTDVTTSVIDRSGQGNNGGFYNAATSSVKTVGKIGQAMTFDGVDDFIKIPDSSLYDNTTTLTVSVWMKASVADATTSFPMLSKTRSVSGFAGWILYRDSSEKIIFYLHDGSTSRSVASTNTFADKLWHHVVGVYNGTDARLYIDGVLAATPGAFTSALQDNARSLCIGRTPGNDNNCGSVISSFAGTLDDVRIYNRALSASEVQNLYMSGNSIANGSLNDSVTNGLIGMWSFDGADVSDKIYDRSGSGFHGGFFNGATSSAKVRGKIGQALRFDGVDDYVLLPDIIEGLSTASASVWFKSVVNASTTKNFFTQGGAGRDPIVMSFAAGTGSNDYKVRCVFDNGVTTGTAESSSGYNDGAWHLVTCVYDGANVYTYVDGVQAVGDPLTGTIASTANVFTLSSSGSTFLGEMDDARIYNRALSAAEVKKLYALGTSKQNASQNSQVASGLLGLWSLDGPDVTTVISDRSGSGNNGTFVGGATSSAKTVGKIGQAMRFDGVNDAIRIINNIGDNIANLSVSFWMKSDVSTNPGIPVSKGRDASSSLSSWSFQRNGSGQFQFNVWNGSDVQGVATKNGFADTQWHHVVGTYDGANVRIYIDGSAGTPAALTGTVDSNASYPVCIGGMNADSTGKCDGSPFGGIVDDVRVYNRTLSSDEVMRLYNIGR